jgi:Mg-chelatase subunit ChlD
MRVQGAKINPNLVVVDDPILVSDNTSKPRIHNVFIVDASGSMSGSKYTSAINGLNEILNGIHSDVDSENTLTIVEFEGSSIVRRVLPNQTIPKTYRGMGCGGSTPYLQAIGETLEFIVQERVGNYDVNDKVLVNVFSDGEENTSTGKFSEPKVLKNYINELKNEGVTVTFVGTQSDVKYAVDYLAMDASNTLIHANTAASIKMSFNTTLKARAVYSKKVSLGEDVKTAFYSKTIE